jgi:hypothetical protein
MSALDGVNGTCCDVNQRSLSTESSSLILTSGQSIGLAVSVLSSAIRPTLSRVQLTVEASFLSLGAILVILVLIVVRFVFFFGFAVQFGDFLRRETCYVIERPSQMATGSCYGLPLTYTWCASFFRSSRVH